MATRKMKSSKGTAAKARAFNEKAHWKAYKELQTRADKAWVKFRTNVKKNARPAVLVKDHNNLLLILGECNYMARQYKTLAAKAKKRK